MENETTNVNVGIPAIRIYYGRKSDGNMAGMNVEFDKVLENIPEDDVDYYRESVQIINSICSKMFNTVMQLKSMRDSDQEQNKKYLIELGKIMEVIELFKVVARNDMKYYSAKEIRANKNNEQKILLHYADCVTRLNWILKSMAEDQSQFPDDFLLTMAVDCERINGDMCTWIKRKGGK
jgi:hypothetical protein